MINKLLNHTKVSLLVLDLFCLNISLYLAPALTAHFENLCISTNYFYQAVFLNALWVLIAYFKKLYDNFWFTESTVILRQINSTSLSFLLFSGFFFFILSLDNYQTSCTFLSFIFIGLIFILLILLQRIILLSLRKKYRNKIIPRYNIVLLGKDNMIDKMYATINARAFDYNISGVFNWHSPAITNSFSPNLFKGNFNDLLSFISNNKVHEICCDYGNTSADDMQKLLLETDRRMIRLRFYLDSPDAINHNAKIIRGFGDVPVITFRNEPLQEEFNQFIKRLFDVVFSSLMIIFVLSWLTPILALLIKIDSKGPVFFKQVRSGKNNKPFFCYKFRSMYANDSADSEQATVDDKRFTKIGRFLRKTSIDELPQFINVLKNDMSVIGPRPHMIAHTEKYKLLLNNYMIRHFLKPGITGWAQVNGYRGETKKLEEMKQRIEHDVYYLENWSFFFDLKIVFLTVWLLLKE